MTRDFIQGIVIVRSICHVQSFRRKLRPFTSSLPWATPAPASEMQVSLAMQNCGLVTERRACHYQAICPAGLDFMEGRTMVAILTQSFCTCRLLSGKIDLNSKPRVRRVVRAASTSLEHFHEQESGIPAPQHETVQGACSSGRPGLEQPFHSSLPARERCS